MSEDIRVHIPPYDTAWTHCREGSATALEKFISEYEPAGDTDVEWRRMLTAVVRDAIGNERRLASELKRLAERTGSASDA